MGRILLRSRNVEYADAETFIIVKTSHRHIYHGAANKCDHLKVQSIRHPPMLLRTEEATVCIAIFLCDDSYFLPLDNFTSVPRDRCQTKSKISTGLKGEG